MSGERMLRVGVCVLVACGVLGCVTRYVDNGETFQVHGRVVDAEDGTPLADVCVVFRDNGLGAGLNKGAEYEIGRSGDDGAVSAAIAYRWASHGKLFLPARTGGAIGIVLSKEGYRSACVDFRTKSLADMEDGDAVDLGTVALERADSRYFELD